MDLVMGLECCYFHVPWSERWSQPRSFGDGGPQNKKFLRLCTFRLDLEHPDPSPGRESFMSHARLGHAPPAEGEFQKVLRAALGSLVVSIPLSWSCLLHDPISAPALGVVDLNSKTGTRKMLPYLPIWMVIGVWGIAIHYIQLLQLGPWIITGVEVVLQNMEYIKINLSQNVLSWLIFVYFQV